MKNYYWLVITVIGVVFLGLGVYRQETMNILNNATTLCLSCLGLQ